MRIALIVLSILVTLIVTLGVIGFSMYVAAYDNGNRMEQDIRAQYTNTLNILSNYGKKVNEVAQVPTMYSDDLAKVAKEAIQGRYGKDGSKATFQWIQEHNPTVDPSLYKQIQQVIEAGRNDFQNSQSQLIDKRRVYETELGSFWGHFWLTLAGYPKIKLSDYDIITDDATQTASKTKKQESFKLR